MQGSREVEKKRKSRVGKNKYSRMTEEGRGSRRRTRVGRAGGRPVSRGGTESPRGKAKSAPSPPLSPGAKHNTKHTLLC